MALTKSNTQYLKELAAGNAGKILPDAHGVSGKLHFQHALVIVGNGTGQTPAGTTGDRIILDEIPSGVALIPGLFNVVGGHFNGTTHNIYVTTDPTGSTGSEYESYDIGTFTRSSGNAPTFPQNQIPQFIPASRKRRYLFLEQAGGALPSGTIGFNIVGVRAE